MGARNYLAQAIKQAPDRGLALVSSTEKVTWMELRSRIEWLDERWTACGLPPGIAVQLSLHSDVASVIALLTCLTTGRTVLPQSRPLDHEDSALAPADEYFPADAPALLLRTSGSTGKTKQVMISDEALGRSLQAAGRLDRNAATRWGQVALSCVSLTHIAGLTTILAQLSAGRTVALLPKFTTDAFVETVLAYSVGSAFLVPSSLFDLAQLSPSPALPSLRFVTVGGATCPPGVAKRFHERIGVPVLPTYGATEFAGAVVAWDLALHRRWWPRKAGSSGRVLDGWEATVRDDDNRPVEPGHEGWLAFRSLEAGQWQSAGDRGRIDSDGFIWVTGRGADVVTRNGNSIAVTQIVDVVRSHPCVREAVAVGRPDQRVGETLHIVVEVAATCGHPQQAVMDSLWTACRRELARYQLPDSIWATGSMPRLSNGKVNFHHVKESIL